MAVIDLGSIVGDIRGSVGNETYGRNQGGLYVRARTGPGDPPTAAQIKITDAMTVLSQYWSATCTEQQRANWRAYAHMHPRRNRWGCPSLTNGYTRFIGTNFRTAIPAGIVNWPDAPPTPPLHPPALTFSIVAATNTVTVALPPPNYPDLPTQALVLAYWGDAVNAGINFYGSPWTYAGQVFYIAGVGWVPDPWNLNYAAGIAASERLYMKFFIQDIIGGAISNPYQDFAEAT